MTENDDATDDSLVPVATIDEIGEGERVLAEIAGREVGVFNIDGEFYAYLNWCAHQGGPLCEGSLSGRVEATYDRNALRTEFTWVAENETLICPWHDWEYDIRSGKCVSKPGIDLPSYSVIIEDGTIKVDLDP